MSESFFTSRWVSRPPGLLDCAAIPAGFRFAALAAGVKGPTPAGLDVGLIVAEPAGTVSAVRFCDSGVLAAPVVVTRERCDPHGLRAVVANSGNANAATGEAGLEQAVAVQEAAAAALGLDPREVAVASTGVIGVPLPGGRIAAALPALAGALGVDPLGFAHAIRTTDVLDKHVALELELPSGSVRIAAQCKGAGMISPRFATMLCFVQTDVALDAQTAELLLGASVKRSFDRISVDGQLSTNDTVILMASGASGVRIERESEDELRLGEALDALLRQLALRIVADGEGARRIGCVRVRGAGEETVARVARGVANSPLVKAALFGGDPNWGRVAQAIGAATAGRAPLRFDIAIEGVSVARDGAAAEHDAAALAAAVARDEVLYEIELEGTGAEAELFFSDLSYDYVKINAEYTT
ncbi:MAG: bifunctional glutamate N-acetyltransferase/amino-acid acetyltransferase ArgJ [Solirubrobacteraceae bacterium]